MRFRLALVPLVLLLLAACGGDDEPAPTPTPGFTPGNTPVVTTITPVPPTRPPSPTPPPTLTIGARAVTGLFVEPRPAPAVRSVTLPAPPAPTMPAHDGRSVTVYDVVENKRTVFEPGFPGGFNGDRLVYTTFQSPNSSEVSIVDVKTGAKRSLGPGAGSSFVDADTVLLGGEGLFDLKTGGRTPLDQVPEPRRSQVARLTSLSARGIRLTDGTPVAVSTGREKAQRDCKALPTEGDAMRCEYMGFEEITLSDSTGRELYRFRALDVRAGAPGEALVASSPQCTDGTQQIWCGETLARLGRREYPDFSEFKATTNIFTLDLATGAARFIATARYEADAINYVTNWPLTADANYVTWTEAFCSIDQRGRTRILDRRTGAVSELDKSLWVELHGGKLGVGEFGAKSLIDPATLRYTAALPEVQGDVRWSEDYRYAAVGQPLGHGGLCR